jgi:hypothetical protein
MYHRAIFQGLALSNANASTIWKARAPCVRIIDVGENKYFFLKMEEDLCSYQASW